MKKYIYVLLLCLGIVSCQNEKWSFPDFDYTTTYFPYQFPVRTLVLGDYNYDNSGDNDGRFLISATMGGVYENKSDVLVNFSLDESLTANLFRAPDTLSVLPLPRNYYSLSNDNQIVIPKNSFAGGVDVKLTDAFFDDPLAITGRYVIPLRITKSTTDSVLMGQPSVSNPDVRIAKHWAKKPKNYTIFAVRFVNEYHGKYLLRGKSVITDLVGNPIDVITYRKPNIVNDEVVAVNTSGRYKVTYENAIRMKGSQHGKFQLEMTFGANGACTIVNTGKFAPAVTGAGTFVKNAEEWGNQKRNTLYLAYQINDGTNLHNITDTLVFRDKAVKFMEFAPLIHVNGVWE